MIGFSELDTTYESTPYMQFSHCMTAALMTAVALAEIRGEMSLTTFAQYHWVLSVGLLPWQLGDTSTSLGVAMFLLPHVFTLWGTLLHLSGESDNKAKKK